MGCGCGGSKQAAAVVAAGQATPPQPLQRGEMLPGTTWNGPQPKKP